MTQKRHTQINTFAAVVVAIATVFGTSQYFWPESKVASWPSLALYGRLKVQPGIKLALLHRSDPPIITDESNTWSYPKAWKGHVARICVWGSAEYIQVILTEDELALPSATLSQEALPISAQYEASGGPKLGVGKANLN